MMGSRCLADVSPKDGAAAGDAGLILARRADLELGGATVRPSLRTIAGPAGSLTIEPRVMQVLLALHDAGGAVRTREDLLQACWGGVIVGEDSLHRAIAEVRRAARVTGGTFSVETIPRVGYRLTVPEGAHAQTEVVPPPDPEAQSERPPLMTRRRLVIGGTAAAGFGAGGLWFGLRDRADPRVTELIDRGRAALRDALPASDAAAMRLFREAAGLAPDDAAPWGWLALALRENALRARLGEAEALYREAEQATRRALAIDPREPNARVASAQAQEQIEGRIAYEDRLRAVLADASDNIAGLTALTSFLQSVGRTRESWDANARAVALEPLAAVQQQRRALKHWIFNRQTEADATIDGALRRWPRHPLLWHARLIIYAFTGRPRAALALIQDAETRPPEETPAALEVWRASLVAKETRNPADVQVAREANLAAATRSPGAAANAIIILSGLGEVDAAYAVAEGFLLRRGPIVGRTAGAWGTEWAQHPGHRRTQWLFTPATNAFRADPRYGVFCRDIGLADYWRQRGIAPDY